MTKPRSRYYHRHDHARGKSQIIAARKAEATPKRASSPETWQETIISAYRRGSGAVFDSLQVRALVKFFEEK